MRRRRSGGLGAAWNIRLRARVPDVDLDMVVVVGGLVAGFVEDGIENERVDESVHVRERAGSDGSVGESASADAAGMKGCAEPSMCAARARCGGVACDGMRRGVTSGGGLGWWG